MELYFAPFACSLVPRIVAAEAGVTLTFRQMELYAGTWTDTGERYLETAPFGKVPVLRLDDGSTLTEVSAIVQYLADQNPASGLAPAWGTFERYRLVEWLSFVGTEFHKAILAPVSSPAAAAAVRPFAVRAVEPVRARLVRHLADRSWLLGETFSAADAYLIWALHLSRVMGLDFEVPVLRAYMARARERSSVRDALALETPLAVAAMARQADIAPAIGRATPRT